MFMSLLAGFQVLISQYTGRNDIAIGTPIAGRNRAETEGLIGFFINTLVMRTGLSGETTVSELLAKVRETALGAYAHQEVPFEKVVEELNPERSLGREPLFQVMFIFQNAPRGEWEITGLRMKQEAIQVEKAKFEISLILEEDLTGIRGVLEYATDLFDEVRMKRMVGHLETVLQAMVSGRDKRVGQISLLSQSERQQLVFEWNHTDTLYESDNSLRTLFEQQAESRPEVIAVIYEQEAISYGELNKRANQLSHHLISLGVRPEHRVAVCVDRSAEMVVALLGVLKAGAAYVPVDPTYPRQRIAYMLEDSGAEVVVTQSAVAGSLPEHNAAVVSIDEDWSQIAAHRADNPAVDVSSDNLAYVIYTSGSTGLPKGVQVAHRCVVNFLNSMRQQPGLTPTDLLMAITTLSFDIAGLELYLPLTTGATVEVVSRQVATDAEALKQKLATAGATVMQATPSMWRMLMSSGWGGSPHLKVMCGGEALPKELAAELVDKAESVWNMYGPTETTIWSAVEQVKEVEGNVLIGRPIANTQVYILNEQMKAVPIGVVAEIFIAGDGLARGYLGRVEMTAERFLPDEQSLVAGARMYRTGDLGRYRADGRVECLGRTDQQVKVRGYRIELGEIESVMSECAGVEACAVKVWEDERGNKRLVGYVVSRGEERLDQEEMKEQIRRRLPDHMVPVKYVEMKQMPMTSNGKLDRGRLPKQEEQQREGKEEEKTAVEEIIAGIWGEVLGVKKIGIHENFFELGGDSILSMQVVARAQRSGLLLKSRHIFQHQTIAELAAVVGVLQGVKAPQGIVTGAVPLTSIQASFFAREREHPHHFNQSILLEGRGELQAELVEVATSILLMHHDALRMRFWRQDSRWLQANAEKVEGSTFLRIDLSSIEGHQREDAFVQIAGQLQSSLILEDALVFRIGYFDLGDKEPARLLLVAHHLIIDRVSLRILLEDLDSIYGQLLRGEPPQLPDKTTSYQQWAEALAHYRRNGDLENDEAEYWLATTRREWELPRDYSLGENKVSTVATVSVELSADETERLLQEAPKAYNSRIQDVLLAALVQSLTKWTGNRGLLLGLERHGREEEIAGANLNRTVGWFASIYPVWLPHVDGKSSRRQVEKIRDLLAAIPQQGIGYGLLRYLQVDSPTAQQLASSPRPEIVFNYQGQFDQVLNHSSYFRLIDGSRHANRSLKDDRDWVIEVNSAISKARFRASWSYSRNLHRRETVEALAHDYLSALRHLLADSCASETQKPEQEPSIVGFDSRDLEAILAGVRVRPANRQS